MGGWRENQEKGGNGSCQVEGKRKDEGIQEEMHVPHYATVKLHPGEGYNFLNQSLGWNTKDNTLVGGLGQPGKSFQMQSRYFSSSFFARRLP